MKFKSIAFQVDIARQMETPSTLKEIIDFGGNVGYNELFLYGEGALEYKNHPSCSYSWALTQGEFIDLQRYATKKFDMRLVPVIPVLGHADFILDAKEHEDIREVRKKEDAIIKCNMRQFCTSNPKTYEVIEEILKEWAQIISAPYLHVGGDESWNFATCPECRKKAKSVGRGKMLAEYFNRINTIVKKYGKQIMIWHDMLFYFDDCLPHLDKDIIICDWHYEAIERHPGISIYNWIKTDFHAAYKKQELPFFICSKSKCNYPEESANIKSFIQYSRDRKPAGFLNTVWEMLEIPYASSYPSLAYGAACCHENDLPDPRTFLHQFIEEHFSGNIDILPLLVDLFSETADMQVLADFENWITYQNSDQDIFLAEKLDEGVTLLKEVQGKTIPGKAYREALELILRRMAIAKRLQGTVNEIARLYLSKYPDKKNIMTLLEKTPLLINKIPAQIRLEQEIWAKSRPEDQNNPVVDQLNTVKIYLLEFVESIKKVLSGQTTAMAVLPTVLELTLVNNDCSWQDLSIFTSKTGKEYYKVGNYPQCGPFGRYIKTFKLPNDGNFIKLEIAGFGQLLVHYVRVIGPGIELLPEQILKVEGAVVNPENILTDDFKPVVLGSVNSKDYFSHGNEQHKSIIEIKNQQREG